MHLWEFWKQTGLQGDWHSHFGGRWHDFDTPPLFVRMPYEDGDDVTLEKLLSDWANEANGQCLGADVQHIVFHIGRYHHCPKAKAWVKHHHRLQIPSTFQCAQRTSTGQGGQGTFVLRGVIAHQGECSRLDTMSPFWLKEMHCGRWMMINARKHKNTSRKSFTREQL